MARFARPRHDSALVTSYLRQLREVVPAEKRDVKAREQTVTGAIRKAPAGAARSQLAQQPVR